jgi:hypothetical protein
VERIRTFTVLLPPAPQAGASASSATTAKSLQVLLPRVHVRSRRPLIIDRLSAASNKNSAVLAQYNERIAVVITVSWASEPEMPEPDFARRVPVNSECQRVVNPTVRPVWSREPQACWPV